MALSVGVLLYAAIFPAWSYPLAQLQMAHALWPADFATLPNPPRG